MTSSKLPARIDSFMTSFSTARLRQVLQTGEPIIKGTVEAETPAHPGQLRHYMHNYYPDKSKDGTVVGVSCVVQDITERIALAT